MLTNVCLSYRMLLSAQRSSYRVRCVQRYSYRFRCVQRSSYRFGCM